MASSICWNNPRVTITSAIGKVIDRRWAYDPGANLHQMSRSVIIDQWLTFSGSARVWSSLAKL